MGKKGEWKKVNDYCITNGHHNIARVVLHGKDTFEVWERSPAKRLKVFTTADEARAWCADNRPEKPKSGYDFDQLRKALKGETA